MENSRIPGTVHAQPEYQINPIGPPPPGYPGSPIPDKYSFQPASNDFAARREAFLQYWRTNPSPRNTKTVFYELVRIEAGARPHEGIILAALDFVDARQDCADFTLHSLLRLLYQYGDHPIWSPALLERLERTILRFKYWPDEPGIDSLCTWTENHHILYASAAYLAGQHYPNSKFTNSGQTGAEKIRINRPRILRWLDLRFRTGFSEWLSHVYYDEDLTALLSLVDFCEDEEIRCKSAIVIDLILLDMAHNTFHGVFGSTHGRSYENTKKWASNEGTSDTAKLLFGMGEYSGFDNMSAAAFALSMHYRMPPVIAAIAQDNQRNEMRSYQRMGIPVDEAEHWGLGFTNFEDGMVHLTQEAYIHPRTLALTLRMFDAFNWWDNSFFAPFKPYRSLLSLLRRIGLLAPLAHLLERDACRNTREQVNIFTYRTPDYMLSCAQDYRKGYGGDQQHIWQATLAPDAVCFTTHPARLNGPSPNYGTGSGLLPRAAQIDNVVLIIYKLETIPALYVPTRLFYTHAWLPRDKFDEVLEKDGWIFARKNEGYLALRSQHPYRWQEQPGEDCQRELIVDGRENIWICEMGRQSVDGSFFEFASRRCAAELHFEHLRVRYHSPSQGWLDFGWEGQLLQSGQEISLDHYPRYNSPYVKAEFPTEYVEISCGKHSLDLDWRSAGRQIREK